MTILHIKTSNDLSVSLGVNLILIQKTGLPGSSDGKESACNAGDWGTIPESGRSPEEGMATQCNIISWRIPWTEEPGGLQSMWSQRVGHK